MRNDLYNLLDEVSNLFNFNMEDMFTTIPVDVTEEEYGLKVKALVPGFTKEEITISFEEGDLTIEAAHADTKKDGKFLIGELSTTKMKRTLSFGDINEDELKAKLENGILTVDIIYSQPVKKEKRSIVIE